MHEMQDAGHSPDEIAAAVSMTREAYKRLRRRQGVRTPSWAGCRKLGVHVRAHVVTGLRALAAAAETDPATMHRRLLEILLADNNRVALRILGKEALPKGKRRVYASDPAPPRGKRKMRCVNP